MYNAQEISQKIKNECKRKNLTVKKLLEDNGLSGSTISNMSDGKMPRIDSVAKIADYFDCSVDYLLGRQTGNHFNIKNTGDNVGVVGQANAPVTIHNVNEKQLSKQEHELLKIFDSLDVVNQAKLLVFAAELEKGG